MFSVSINYAIIVFFVIINNISQNEYYQKMFKFILKNKAPKVVTLFLSISILLALAESLMVFTVSMMLLCFIATSSNLIILLFDDELLFSNLFISLNVLNSLSESLLT